MATGAERPMRLTDLCIFGLPGGTPLPAVAFVLSGTPLWRAAVGAVGAAAAAGASKGSFGVLFLFDGMVAEIREATAAGVVVAASGKSTTAAAGDAPPAVGEPSRASMDARSGRDGAGKDLAEEIGRRRRRLGSAETLRAQWKRECSFHPLLSPAALTCEGRGVAPFPKLRNMLGEGGNTGSARRPGRIQPIILAVIMRVSAF